MSNLIVLWVLSSPGVWRTVKLEFDVHRECHEVVELLKDRNPPARQWRLWYKYVLYPSDSGTIFEDWCNE